MRVDQSERSDNVEDRRGIGMPGGRLALGGLGAIVIAVVTLLIGGDPRALLDMVSGGGSAQGQVRESGATDPMKEFVARVLGDTEQTWDTLFRAAGETYQPPKLVLFSHAVESACGRAQSAIGPFYCPEDHRVYIDLAFYEELRSRFQAPGDFAQAYVIAHEVGHHVQNLLGITARVASQADRLSEVERNQLSVRLELQADYLAGVWAHHAQSARQILEAGDVEEALRAASAIGDDRLQMQGRGQVAPDTFTHGTSEQRVRWFKLGLQFGDSADLISGGRGDTFRARKL
jgi:predicted metalloprotease